MPPPVSSRTPEGTPNHCPICDAEVRVEPSEPFGDAPCPRCGTLLWFVKTPPATFFYESAAAAMLRERLANVLRRLGLSDPRTATLDIDSITAIELIMGLEDEFQLELGSEEIERIGTIGELFHVVIRRELRG